MLCIASVPRRAVRTGIMQALVSDRERRRRAMLLSPFALQLLTAASSCPSSLPSCRYRVREGKMPLCLRKCVATGDAYHAR